MRSKLTLSLENHKRQMENLQGVHAKFHLTSTLCLEHLSQGSFSTQNVERSNGAAKQGNISNSSQSQCSSLLNSGSCWAPQWTSLSKYFQSPEGGQQLKAVRDGEYFLPLDRDCSLTASRTAVQHVEVPQMSVFKPKQIP